MPSLVLTVNTRLARWRRLEYNERQKVEGRTVWPTPPIHALDSWLSDVWKASWPERFLLSDLQCKKIWEQLVRRHSGLGSSDLLDLIGAGDLAFKAWKLIQEYRLPLNPDLFQLTDESRAFLKWAGAFQNWLQDKGALDPPSLMDAVRERMESGAIPLPPPIIFAGFEEITPQFQAWLDVLNARGVPFRFDPEISSHAPDAVKESLEAVSPRLLSCPNQKEEAVQCARWVRAQYRPGKRIGIVVPDLAGYRQPLQRELSAELAPASVFPWEQKEPPFNISLGTSLCQEPLIQVALLLVTLRECWVPLTLFATVTQSPYLFREKEAQAAYALELKLRRDNTVTVDLDWFPNVIGDRGFQDLQQRAPQLAAFPDLWRRHLEERSRKFPRQWAAIFSKFLKNIGWPVAGKSLSSREYQAYEAWKQGLDQLASLDEILGLLSRGQAAQELTRLLEDQLFQVQTGEQPIQVVGLLESAGMQFDHLWLMGCTDETLPPPPSPNPFLPKEYRARYDLPRSTAQRELRFAETALARLLRAAPDVVVSFPAWDGDTPLRKSPLLHPLDGEDPGPFFGDSHRQKDRVRSGTAMETWEDPRILPASERERQAFFEEGLRGGAQMLKDQSECPFRAFATYRLGAAWEDLPEVDVDARNRGTLVHRVLEIFWHKVGNRSELHRLHSENRLNETLRDSIEKALQHLSGRLARQKRFRELERDRVQNLLADWLELERHRDDFQVEALEKKETVRLNGLRLTVRVDRIDQLPSGKRLLIDYKTGKIHPRNWFSERPKEPQLPLYGIHLEPAGLIFAQVKKGALKMQGSLVPGLSQPGIHSFSFSTQTPCTTWDDLMDYWKNVLEQLAGNFLEGKNEVDPLEGDTTCRNCGLDPLCRVRELDREPGEENESEDE